MKALTPQQTTRLQGMYQAAQQALRSGAVAQAESLYREILKTLPEAWDVHHQLARLLATTGRPSEAVRHFRLVVKGNPTHAVSHSNLASALAESGNPSEAIEEFRRALALDPKLVQTHISLAATLRSVERSFDALPHYKAALDLDRSNHAAFNGLGLAYRDMDDLPRALECFEHAVGLAAQNAEYRVNFGVTLRKAELLQWACDQLHEAIRLKPQFLEAMVLLAETLQEQRCFDEAKACYERALQLKPAEPELCERLGMVYLDMGDTEHALAEFSNVLSRQPERPIAMLGLGRSHMEAGHATEAVAAFNMLVEKHPEGAPGYFYLALSRKFRPDDPVIPRLKELVERKGETERGVVALNFALGKIYDDCKEWDQAFVHYARANQLKNREYNYQADAEEKKFAQTRSVYNRGFFESHADFGVDSRLPVLIVGMPRSGTTLTEQIISSHPGVIGAGEVVFWGRIPSAVPYMLHTDVPYPDCALLMKSEHASEIAEKYLNLLRQIAGADTEPARITDKMPHNFLHLGLIAMLFPNAPIIHCKRDALDNCLSIFFQNFKGDHPYAYSLPNLGHHYNQYRQLMAHWHEVLPGRIFDLQYEDVIADPEYWSRKLIEFVGLPWNDACLAPHKLERTVKTASQWQVRQPIYRTSVQRWKNYEKHLGPLKRALGYEDSASNQ